MWVLELAFMHLVTLAELGGIGVSQGYALTDGPLDVARTVVQRLCLSSSKLLTSTLSASRNIAIGTE